jgi:hypothetical protein
MCVRWNNKEYTNGNVDFLKLLIFTGIEKYVTASEEKDLTDTSLRTGATSIFYTHISGVHGGGVG